MANPVLTALEKGFDKTQNLILSGWSFLEKSNVFAICLGWKISGDFVVFSNYTIFSIHGEGGTKTMKWNNCWINRSRKNSCFPTCSLGLEYLAAFTINLSPMSVNIPAPWSILAYDEISNQALKRWIDLHFWLICMVDFFLGPRGVVLLKVRNSHIAREPPLVRSRRSFGKAWKIGYCNHEPKTGYYQGSWMNNHLGGGGSNNTNLW